MLRGSVPPRAPEEVGDEPPMPYASYSAHTYCPNCEARNDGDNSRCGSCDENLIGSRPALGPNQDLTVLFSMYDDDYGRRVA